MAVLFIKIMLGGVILIIAAVIVMALHDICVLAKQYRERNRR